MTYPQHWLGVFGGFLGPSESQAIDEWQCTIRLAPTGIPDNPNPDPATVLTNEFKTAVEGFLTDGTGQSPWSSYAQCTYLKLNEIGPDGRYVDKTNTNLYEYPSTGYIRGSTAPASFDPALALCITWGTANRRGPGHAGRMYVPMPKQLVQGNGRFNASNMSDVALSASRFIQALAVSGVATRTWGACIVSSKGNPGPALEIQKVRVGDVPDHQQRRRNAMVETYVEHVI